MIVGEMAPMCCDFRCDEKYLVTGDISNVVLIWEICSGNCIGKLIGHFGIVKCVTFSPKGHFILSGSADQHIFIWSF